ncbi:scavenger receptor class B member 1 [Xylocopa sonorina]|uniref:scavenger receptor class B member 1 n=1 Tax=Xylocopa sonorina TaxID=1818115 RepID=UPI00403ADC83
MEKRISSEGDLSWGQKRRGCLFYGFTASLSIAVFLLFWCTNVFRDAILSNLEIRNGTESFLRWQRPPVGLNVKVYVFNYTNVAEFESGDAEKLRVEQVGPYVYRETLSRVNVKVNKNETITYQEKKSFEWISGKSEREVVVVPNVLLMSTLAYFRNLPFVVQLGLTALMPRPRSKPFLELPVGEYLWGYEDQLFEYAKPFASFRHSIPYEKFGILASENCLDVDRITMHTGAGDLRNLGLIQRINGLENHRVWDDENCDRIYGTDGSMFPPHWIEQPNSTVYIYAKNVCRRLPFRYERRAYANGIPTLRYRLPSNVFTSTPNKDSCFCPKESHDSGTRKCPPAGTFNISACKLDTPLLVSFPHFYSGDDSLFRKVDGLTPRREHHECYIDLHPRLAVTVDVKIRLQLNLEVRKAIGMPFSGNLDDGLILPLIWLDTGIDDLPESIQLIFHRSHYLVNAIEAGFQWCSLVCAILSLGAFILCLKRAGEQSRNYDHATPLEPNQL